MYIEIWKADRIGLIETAMANLISDLKNGYDPNGLAIHRQQDILTEFQLAYKNGCEKIQCMDRTAANRWCKADLKRRGAI